MAKKNSTAPKKPMIFNSVLLITAENVVSFVKSLPKTIMTEDAFNSYMERNFYFGGKFHGNDFNSGSHYSTIVRQLGLYHILNGKYIPRFTNDIDVDTADKFLKYWLKLYIAPNPTSQPSLRKSVVTPKYVLKEIISFLECNPNVTNIYEIVETIFQQELSRNDKGNLANILNRFSDCVKVDNNSNASLTTNYKNVMEDINALINDPNRYFEHFGKGKKNHSNGSQKLQQIFYGAPGTGKSHEIKNITEGKAVIRTTFHPDSDYSTFVGCYKPSVGIGRVYGAQGPLTDNGKPIEEPKITYKYVMQAFLKAYLGAWKKYADRNDDKAEPQFLVIEEINRGNCAQIFGDLFQLLDRGDNSFSEYPIEADADLQQEIERAFMDSDVFKLNKDINVEGIVEDYKSNYGKTLSEDIQEGRVLLLPPNLHIWATMNTSDQSLFPIDSAFKRRWDWVYMPIGYKNNNWTIEIGEKK